MVSFYIEIEGKLPEGYKSKNREDKTMGEQLTSRIHTFLSIKLGRFPDCEIAAREILKELRG